MAISKILICTMVLYMLAGAAVIHDKIISENIKPIENCKHYLTFLTSKVEELNPQYKWKKYDECVKREQSKQSINESLIGTIHR